MQSNNKILYNFMEKNHARALAFEKYFPIRIVSVFD